MLTEDSRSRTDKFDGPDALETGGLGEVGIMSAPFFVWDAKTIALNVHDMDEEHQVLIEKMNALYELAQKKARNEQIERAIEELIRFTVKHFADEEAFMASFAFPGIATHKVIHQQLIARLNEHHNEFKIRGVCSDAFFDFLRTWLTSHIRGIDMKYARAYLDGGARKTA